VDNSQGAVSSVEDGEVEPEKKRRLPRGCGCWIAVAIVLLLVGGGAATVGGMTILREKSPLPLEPEITDIGKRLLMIPAEYADMRVPNGYADPKTKQYLTYRDPKTKQPTAAVMDRAKKLFLDGDNGWVGCALCHGPNGIADSNFGIAMYPPANDLTAALTQGKSDGQLYWLISHGVNLTGMPAWNKQYGGPYEDSDIWSLVLYVRSLPHPTK